MTMDDQLERAYEIDGPDDARRLSDAWATTCDAGFSEGWGHVGPDCVPEFLRVTRPGALFCCGTISAIFGQMGFGAALTRLVAQRRITPVRFRAIAISEGAVHPHAGDKGVVMVFRTT